MTDTMENKCELCGEPMPENETMFKYHGYSGPCPRRPLPLKERRVAAEQQLLRAMVYDGKMFISDTETPVIELMKPATVIKLRWHQEKGIGGARLLVDVIFDERPDEVSRGHFADLIEPILEDLNVKT